MRLTISSLKDLRELVATCDHTETVVNHTVHQMDCDFGEVLDAVPSRFYEGFQNPEDYWAKRGL